MVILFVGLSTLLTLAGQLSLRPPTVLLVPLEAKDDKSTQNYKTAFPLTTREDGVLFDLDGDGRLEQVAWTRPNASRRGNRTRATDL